MSIIIKRYNNRRCKTSICIEIFKWWFPYNFIFKSISSQNIQIFGALQRTRRTLQTENLKTQGRDEELAFDDGTKWFLHLRASCRSPWIHNRKLIAPKLKINSPSKCRIEWKRVNVNNSKNSCKRNTPIIAKKSIQRSINPKSRARENCQTRIRQQEI